MFFQNNFSSFKCDDIDEFFKIYALFYKMKFILIKTFYYHAIVEL